MKRKAPEPGKRRGASWDMVPRKLRPVLAARPIRNEDFLKWERKPDGKVVITHSKNLKTWERKWMKVLGGTPVLRRPLDKYGSDIWVLLDGEHTVADICDALDQKYKEEIEPVLTHVTEFLEKLLERNLVYMKGSAADLARAERLAKAEEYREERIKGGGK